MKTIFNSLGSNYSIGFAFKAILSFFSSSSQDCEKLKTHLEKLFSGKASLHYKGRDSIQYALMSCGINQGDSVITQAFTCHAIEEAIARTKATVVYADLEKNSINPSLMTLEAARKRATHPMAVIIQHTLGNPADIKNIRSWCDEHQLLLIEDLAQAIGATDADGKPLGTYADVVVLSFGRDKVVDAVSGGASIIKIKHQKIPISQKISALQVIKDLFYPLLTWIIRNTHHVILGKVIYRLSRSIGLITNPTASPTRTFSKLPGSHAKLALIQLNKLPQNLTHRLQIAMLYHKQFHENELNHPQIATNLRYNLEVADPVSLGKKLKKSHIEITDRWYRCAVDSGTLNLESDYQDKLCPNAEYLSKHIFNLPTHQYIHAEQARKIISIINNQPDN